MRKKFNTMFEESTIERLKIQAILEKTDVSKILEKLALEYLEMNCSTQVKSQTSPCATNKPNLRNEKRPKSTWHQQ